MPAYLRRILASGRDTVGVRSRAVLRHPTTQWIGLAAGYTAVLAAYAIVLVALFTPSLAVAIARAVLVVVALAGVAALGIALGRLLARRTPTAAQR